MSQNNVEDCAGIFYLTMNLLLQGAFLESYFCNYRLKRLLPII